MVNIVISFTTTIVNPMSGTIVLKLLIFSNFVVCVILILCLLAKNTPFIIFIEYIKDAADPMPNATWFIIGIELVQNMFGNKVCLTVAINVSGAAPNVDTDTKVAPRSQGFIAARLPVYRKSCLCFAIKTSNPIKMKESAFNSPWQEKYVIIVIWSEFMAKNII